jgi:hypothetical protein
MLQDHGESASALFDTQIMSTQILWLIFRTKLTKYF